MAGDTDGRWGPDLPARIRWALELLGARPGDDVLEVGCGPGVALAELCRRLDGGTVLGIDRSATAVARSRTRLADHLRSGRASLRQVELARLDGPAAAFDRVFAVNVNAFWTDPARAGADVLARVLRPGGVVLLVYDRPGGDARAVGPTVAAALAAHGFAAEVRAHPSDGLVAVSGRLAEPVG